jgi:hypothetical protein
MSIRPFWSRLPSQIFVEVELARLTMMLAKMKEDDGNIAGASDTLQEIQVLLPNVSFFLLGI